MVAYHRPLSLAEALAIRAEADVAILAGGTDIYPARTTRRAWGDPTHKDVLDISGIAELRGIGEDDGHWRFGCLATWTDLIRTGLPAQFDAYRQAAREVGGVQVQNSGTLVGNVVTASPAGDGLPNLLALDAEVELKSTSGSRRLPFAGFVDGYRHTQLAADEIVTALIVPKRRHAVSRFAKLGARKYLVISIAMVAVVLDLDNMDQVTDARIAVGACSAVATRLGQLEADLAGAPIRDVARVAAPRHVESLEPIDDIRASGSYRRAAALTLVRDCLAGLAADHARRAA